jgi:Flp pilus assembly protein TadG
MRRRRQAADIAFGRERGAAVVDFAMVSVLLIFVLFAVLQVAVYFYVRNIASASAANGARYAASSNVPVADGGPHANHLLSEAAASSVSRGVTCTGSADVDPATGLQLAVVRCRGHLRSTFLPIGPMVTIDVRSSALKESAS